jgi:transaldolase
MQQDNRTSPRSLTERPKTRILIDGGDPEETLRIKSLLGFLDGQTTNPSLVAKSPDIVRLVAAGQRLTEQQESAEYKKIVQRIAPLVGDAGVSIEVFSDLSTSAEQMLNQGEEMYKWIPNAYIKYPCTSEGLRAAHLSVAQGMRVNITLCFSQAQAAAVYAATKGSAVPVYVSPFIGRLDGIGKNGMDLIKNIQRMFAKGDGHVQILAASLRSLEHLLCCFFLETELATVPAKTLEEWAAKKFPMPGPDFEYRSAGTAIPYEDIDLEQRWETIAVEHELTRGGIQRFVTDYQATLRRTSSAV